ncbi:MAG: hypothetical protein IJS61_07350 [Firmicutes bacterium]|nr:hypothetical protein [Bacillota bacterium]
MKIQHKTLKTILSLAFAAGLCVGTQAEEKTAKLTVNEPVISVNSEQIPLDTAPVIVEGRTLVPVRAVVEAMGGEVLWDAETKTVTLTYNDDKIELTINSTTAKLNDEDEELDVAPIIKDSTTMLPLRFVAESFGYNTDWDAETKTVTVSSAASEEEMEDTEETGGFLYYHEGEDGSIFSEMKDRTFAHDKDGNLIGEFLDTDVSEEVFTDKDGKTPKFVYDENKVTFVNAQGEMKKIVSDIHDPIRVDEDGNSYEYTPGSIPSSVIVRNKEGEITEQLLLGDVNFIYKDTEGNKLTQVISKFGTTPYMAYILPSGTTVKCKNDYDLIYTDKDNNLYSIYYDWFVEVASDGTATKYYRPMYDQDVFTDEKGNEYSVYINDENERIFIYPDAKNVVLQRVNDDPDTRIYKGDDDKTYTVNDVYLNIKDESNNETKLTYLGLQRIYSSNGQECKLLFGDEKDILTKSDGTKLELKESFGEG